MGQKGLLVGGIIFLIIAALVTVFVFTRGNSQEKVTVAPTPTPQSVELLPDDALEVTIAKGSAPRYVLTIDTIPDGVTGLSYELTYDTTNKGSQGVTGGLAEPIAIKKGQTKYVNNQVVFGSESRGKYDLDKGVSNIQINIRLTYSDGSEKGWKGALEI